MGTGGLYILQSVIYSSGVFISSTATQKDIKLYSIPNNNSHQIKIQNQGRWIDYHTNQGHLHARVTGVTSFL